jgi:hypothetical protein
MKKILSVIMGVLLFAGAFTPQNSNAAAVFIEIGDRPYYLHGDWYWSHGYRWCWVPGHWRWHHHYRSWIHGHYVRCH